MSLEPDTRPRSFSAEAEFATDWVALLLAGAVPRWRDPLALRLTDSFDGGRGLLEVRVLACPCGASAGQTSR